MLGIELGDALGAELESIVGVLLGTVLGAMHEGNVSTILSTVLVALFTFKSYPDTLGSCKISISPEVIIPEP